MDDYFCFDDQTGMPCMIPNNEDQTNLVPLNTLNSSFPKEGTSSATTFVDLPPSISMIEHLNNVDSTSGQNAAMNSSVSGTNLMMPNNSLVQMDGSSSTEASYNLFSLLRYLESNKLSNSVMPGILASNDVEITENELKRKKIQHSTAAASESNARGNQIVYPTFTMQDPRALLEMAKLPSLDVNHEELLRQHLQHQVFLRQNLMQVQNKSMQLNEFIQQQKQQNYLEQQIIWQSVPQFQLEQRILPKEDQLRHLLQCQQTPQQMPTLSSFPVGVCHRRVMEYLYDLRNRPQDNDIGYWHKLVSEYYSPGAKMRWCFSLYKNMRNHMTEGWNCDVCGSRSGKGFEACFDMLPRQFQINFASHLVDEIPFLEMPQECMFPTGFLMLEYGKAVIVSVYKQGRVAREGKLRVLFRQDLKIQSWEFCALSHEEYLNRQQLSLQINQFIKSVEKCKTDDISAEDFKSNCNKFADAGEQLVRAIELPSGNGLGLSSKFVRFLQVAEVLNSMRDLMAFSIHDKIGAIESLNRYVQEESSKGSSSRKRIKQGKQCSEIPSTSGMQVLQCTDSALLSNLSDSKGTKRANPEPVGVDKNLEPHQLVWKMVQEKVTNSTTEIAKNAVAEASSSTGIVNDEVPKAPQSSNPSSSPPIKQETYFF